MVGKEQASCAFGAVWRTIVSWQVYVIQLYNKGTTAFITPFATGGVTIVSRIIHLPHPTWNLYIWILFKGIVLLSTTGFTTSQSLLQPLWSLGIRSLPSTTKKQALNPFHEDANLIIASCSLRHEILWHQGRFGSSGWWGFLMSRCLLRNFVMDFLPKGVNYRISKLIDFKVGWNHLSMRWRNWQHQILCAKHHKEFIDRIL